MSSAIRFNLDQSEFLSSGNRLRTLKKRRLQKTVWEKEKMQPAFSPFPAVFSVLPDKKIIISATFNLKCANAFNLVTFKNLLFGKELYNKQGA